MIENFNASKTASSGEYVDVRKYIGVASVNILSINPSNATLRKYGWAIPEDADEPKYVTITERDGRPQKSARVRFLAEIQDLQEKPIVALDFWIRPEVIANKDATKAKIIDAYTRTAWGTKDEINNHQIPQYASGPASISTPYKLCHSGEEELVNFIFKYLNITPLQFFSREKQEWVPSKNPGRLTIDNWKALCDGNTKEIAEYIALQPKNCVKVVLGVRTTEDNKTYQSFLNTTFISNGSRPDMTTGEYTAARKAIDKYFDGKENSAYSFSALPVKEWKETATEVTDNSASGTMFDDEGNFVPENIDDLPFD